VETRLLTRYDLLNDQSVFLIGAKYYDANNDQRQGPGTNATGPDFSFASGTYPDYARQSQFDFPNKNLAIFGENIFNISEKLSITPGFRFEYINTASNGSFKNIILDLAGNPLQNETVEDSRDFERSFVLLGLGASYSINPKNELYANISQNYRSVTFNDIRVVNPNLVIDPNITDEEGFTADVGVRGRLSNKVSYDLSVFGLRYNDRIGVVDVATSTDYYRYKSNIGDAFIYGVETFADWDLKNTFFEDLNDFRLNYFMNVAFTSSEYVESNEINVEENEVEFIPNVNLKTGLNFGYKNFLAGIQYTYLSEQFSDATNAQQDKDDRINGIRGAIPSYGIMDLSASYTLGRFKLEAGINNLLDNSYFTRRATGYPGPGIIPAQPLTWYSSLQIKL